MQWTEPTDADRNGKQRLVWSPGLGPVLAYWKDDAWSDGDWPLDPQPTHVLRLEPPPGCTMPHYAKVVWGE